MASPVQQRFYEFGLFRIDVSRRLLLRRGAAVPLTPKAFEILLILVQNRDRIMEKDELMRRVWPDTAVEENNLTRNISTLRKALEEGPGEHRFIVTIPGRGYQFAAEARATATETEIVFERHARAEVRIEEESDEELAIPVLPKPKPRDWRRIRIFVGVSVVVLAALTLIVALVQHRSSQSALLSKSGPIPVKVPESIAVLPFDISSADPELEYLADGVTESTIDHLSRSPDIKVISLASVLPYRGRHISPQEIGRTLGVRRVMMGKIVIERERMIVLAELINAADGTHLWGEQYNRKVADIIDVQEDIGTEISAKLRIGKTQEQQKLIRRRYTDDFEAYKLYIRGRYYWNKRDIPDLQRGLSYFQQAIDRDPTYALAYAGLADSYFVESAAGALPAREGLPKAKAAAMRALELDDSLAEAHTSLAHVLFNYDWNWTEAEAEYKKAIALSPSYSYAHCYYGAFLMAMSRKEEAFAELQRAQELDPLSPMITTLIGKEYYFARDNRESLAQYRKVIQYDPHFPVAANFLVETLERSGSVPEALAEMEEGTQPTPAPDALALRRAYTKAGVQGYLRERIRQIRQQPQDEAGGLSGGSAALYSVLGDKDNAFAMLDRAFGRHEIWLVYLNVDPTWDNLRSDPRFQDLLRRVGLA